MHTVSFRRYFTVFFCYYWLVFQQDYFCVRSEVQNNQLFTNCINTDTGKTIYDYSSYDIQDDNKQNPISFSKYKGKTLLIVNTASYCGYTHQYPFFNKLKNHYASKDFEILAFPCNQFGLQEPGVNAAEILNALRYVRPGNNYIPNFLMFERSDVNGYGERPLYTFLKSVCPTPTDEFSPWPNITYVPMRSQDVRWNFVKFLIDPYGRPVKRFASAVTPDQLRSHIDAVMAHSQSKRRYQNVLSLSDQFDRLLDEDDTSK